MDRFLNSVANQALNHVSQQQLRYSVLLGAVAFSSGCSWINRYLSADALNHGTPADFDWDKEIVVVTGGAGGIGGEIVQNLAERGTTVIVLDVMELTYDACK
jgi:3-oxoacyl-ACP reductase-like protein